LDCGNAGNLRLYSELNNASIQLGQLSGTGGVLNYYVGSGGNHDFYGASVVRSRLSSDGSRSSVIPGGSTLLPEFQCRAWVNFNGTGTLAIRASGNVSSITDAGVGVFLVNFATAMPDTGYSTVASGDGPVNSNHCIPFVASPNTGGGYTTSSVNVSWFTDGNSSLRADPIIASVAIFR
jgi:hypothetical protein